MVQSRINKTQSVFNTIGRCVLDKYKNEINFDQIKLFMTRRVTKGGKFFDQVCN